MCSGNARLAAPRPLRRTRSAPNLLTQVASDKASYRKLWEAAEGGAAAKNISSLQVKIEQAEAALQMLRQSHASMVQCKERLLSRSGWMVDGTVAFGEAPHSCGAKPRERHVMTSGGSSPNDVMVDLLSPRSMTM